MANEPAVMLIRHGKTRLNNETDLSLDRIRGWKDIPLDREGVKEAHSTAKKLENTKIDKFYCSDLDRAKTTAKIINSFHRAPLHVTKDFRPWGLGEIEGQKTNEVLPEMQRLIKEEDEVPKGGESFKDFRNRVLLALTSVINEAIKKKTSIAIASHYRDLKLIYAWQKAGFPRDLSIDTDEMMTKDGHETGEVYKLPLDKFMARK